MLMLFMENHIWYFILKSISPFDIRIYITSIKYITDPKYTSHTAIFYKT